MLCRPVKIGPISPLDDPPRFLPPPPTQDDIHTFFGNGIGPKVKYFRIDYLSAPRSPWNARAITVFINSFMKSDYAKVVGEEVGKEAIRKAFTTHYTKTLRDRWKKQEQMIVPDQIKLNLQRDRRRRRKVNVSTSSL